MTWWDGAEAILNAVVGDYLDGRGSDLAIDMGLYHRGRPLGALPRGTPRLCVFVHGMALTERSWAFPEEPETDFGALLERERGLTPLYVRYNTGLPIWKSGQQLAELLESVVERSPVPVEEITLIGHSLGGLVIRSACRQANKQAWLPLVRRAFYLASPHLGSPLEKAGHLATSVLQAIDDPVVQLIADLAELRSAAVKDLRHGDLVESRETVELDERIEHYLVAGSLPGPLAGILGDGLVRAGSATGVTAEKPLPPDHVGNFPGLHHMAIVHDADVYQWISNRCGPPVPTTPAQSNVTDRPTRRLAAVVELLGDVVDKGSSAVQTVHEAIAARPYQVLEVIPPLQAPTRAVRDVHRSAVRGSYAAVRLVNELIRMAVRGPENTGPAESCDGK